MRYQHILSPIKGDKMPKSIVAVDCETDGLVQEVGSNERRVMLVRWHSWSTLLGTSRPGKTRYSSGTDSDSFWRSIKWLLDRGGVTWIISNHCGKVWSLLNVWERIENGTLHICGKDCRGGSDDRLPLSRLSQPVPLGGEGSREGTDSGLPPLSGEDADSTGRLAYSHKRSNKVTHKGYLVLEDPPNVMHARVDGSTGTIHWVDSRNYGVSIDEPEITADELAHRLHSFATAMLRILKDRVLGGLKDTAGSQAMASFRRKHLGHIITCHTNVPVLDLESAAYYGGRCEVFCMGSVAGPIHHYDFRSLYPSICASDLLPVRLRLYADRDAALVARQQSNLLACIASVTIETTEPCYPYRRHGLVTWPVGRFRTELFGPELAHAVASGRVGAWHSIAVYDMEYALRSFALEFDDIRSKARTSGNAELARWAKAVGVCLPGKFAQRDKRWLDVPCNPPFDYYDEWYVTTDEGIPERWRTIAGVTQYEHRGEWGQDSVPSIAGYITSAARMRLHNAINIVGRSNVLYCDTDSLFVTATGSAKLVQSGLVQQDALGRLRLIEVYSECDFRGIKDYTADGRHVCSGLPVGSSDATLDGYTYWWRPWIGLSTAKHRRPTADQVLRGYNRTQPYRHGTVLADGTVEPLRIWE